MIDYSKFQLSLRDYDRTPVKTYEDYMEGIKKSVLATAEYLCMKEIYARAQPTVDYDDLLKDHFDRIQKGLEPVSFYERYYINKNELEYVVNKYLEAYNLKDPWDDYLNLLIKDAKEGYTIDKYVPEHTDEDGFNHPGYRDYDHEESIEKQINEILNDESKSKEIAELFNAFIDNRKRFYRRHQLESAFNFAMYLGHSPYSIADRVIEYWKSQGKDIEIDLREHDLDYFYDEEYGYLEDEISDDD